MEATHLSSEQPFLTSAVDLLMCVHRLLRFGFSLSVFEHYSQHICTCAQRSSKRVYIRQRIATITFLQFLLWKKKGSVNLSKGAYVRNNSTAPYGETPTTIQ